MKRFLKAAVISLIAVLIFFLTLQNRCITGTADNNTGCFAVSIEDYSSSEEYGSVKYVYFFDEQGQLVKTIDFHIRGGIEIFGNSDTVTVTNGDNCWFYDYSGNEKDSITGEPVTEVYSPVTSAFSVSKQINFWGYEYIVTETNGITKEIHLDKSLYTRKLINAVFNIAVYSLIIFCVKRVKKLSAKKADE